MFAFPIVAKLVAPLHDEAVSLIDSIMTYIVKVP
jgi:hypothetical protein